MLAKNMCHFLCISARFVFSFWLTSTRGFAGYHFINLVPICLNVMQIHHFNEDTWVAITTGSFTGSFSLYGIEGGAAVLLVLGHCCIINLIGVKGPI